MTGTALFSPDSFFAPTLTDRTEVVIRVSYAILLLLTLIQAATQSRRFFVSEKWGGYAQAWSRFDWFQSPVNAWIVLGVWCASAVSVVFGIGRIWPALLNFLFAWHFFIRMRWRGVLRGMGAPGFLTYWLAAVVLGLELTRTYAPSVRPLMVLVAQVDFALIMLSAGVYKLTAGYARNHGMEYGLVNPEWGYWWRRYRNLPPGHWLFRLLNHLAWSTEVVAAILMLVPATRLVGALLLLVSFIFIASHIRLGFLCEMVIVATALFFHAGSFASDFLIRVFGSLSLPVASESPAAASAISIFLWTYLVLLPIAHGGLFYNFYGRRRLPGVLQRVLEKYTNFFGVIIWRVFSVDVVNFYILIYRQRRDGEGRQLVSRYGWRGGFRFSHVGESIAVTSLFTTLKYYPSNEPLFVARVLRYARTIPCAPGEVVVFEYVCLAKDDRGFRSSVAAEFVVDPRAGTVHERVVDGNLDIRMPHAVSPVHEASRPGTYVPFRA